MVVIVAIALEQAITHIDVEVIQFALVVELRAQAIEDTIIEISPNLADTTIGELYIIDVDKV